MGCCNAASRTKWGVFALLLVSGIVFTSISSPAYFGILADKSDPDSFTGCAHCIQDFGIEVLKSVNATDIVDKLEKIHERNEKLHPHGHHHHHHHHHDHHEHDFEFDGDECITNHDLEDLKPDLEGLVIPDWKEECKDVCTPVIKAVPLAATISGVLLFVGLMSFIGAVIPLCMLCCACCKNESPAPVQRWQPAVANMSPVGTYTAAGTSAPAPAAAATEDSKTPLLQKF